MLRVKVNCVATDAQVGPAISLGNHERKRSHLNAFILEKDIAHTPQLLEQLWTPSHGAASCQHTETLRQRIGSLR